MIRTLIVDDNMQYCKHIINYIIAESKNLQISYLATDGEEAMKFLSKQEVELLILDLKLPKISRIEILESLTKIKHSKNMKVFLLSGDTELLYKACLHPMVVSYANKIEPIQITYNKIQKIANEIEKNMNEKNVKVIFHKELATLGFNFKYKGTKYLLDSIMYIYLSSNINLLDNLEKYVYKVIAM